MTSKPNTEPEENAPKKTSMVVHIVVFLIITMVAAATGFGASIFIKGEASSAKEEMAAKGKDGEPDQGSMQGDQAKSDKGDTSNKKKGKESEDAELEEGTVLTGYAKPLAPILTNLAAPKNVWVRLELAAVASQDTTDELLEQIHQDLFAYMRTIKLHHIDGPSGYINLKAELNERAAIRSGGVVNKILVRTMLLE